ncbi:MULTISPECIES: hypothetical protein [Anaerolinea]|uniref:hypothetical protein n=1 Tax=Anaerolinea TaxID=233189 RepID=UPI0026172018|nr:hypothetical protein [Anaerolinea thermophila]
MIQNLLTALEQKASGKILLLLLMVLIPFNFLVFPLMQAELSSRSLSPEVQMLDVQIGYTPRQAQEKIAHLGETGRQWYRVITWTADLIYPVLYSSFFALLLAYLLKSQTTGNRYLSLVPLIPFVMAVMDYGENISITVALGISNPPLSVLQIAAAFSALKWAGAVVVLFFTIGLLGYALFNGFQRLRGDQP